MRRVLGTLLSVLLAAVASAQTVQPIVVPTIGGIFALRQGQAQLTVTAGAVSTPTRIFVSGNSMVPESRFLVADSAVSIGRPSLTFSRATTLSIAYEPQNLPVGAAEANLRIYRVIGHKWALVGGTPDVNGKTVSAAITGASTYALLAATTATVEPENAIFLSVPNSGNSSAYRITVPDPANVPGASVTDPLSTTTFPSGLTTISPTLNSVAFVRGSLLGGEDVLVANVDGSFPIRLTSLQARFIGGGTISPDGRSLAFIANVGGELAMYRVELNGTGQKKLATLASKTDFAPPAWNTNGNALVYGDGLNLVTINPTTGAVFRSTTLPTDARAIRGVAFNPAGNQLAATTYSGAYTVATNGSGLTRRLVESDFAAVSFSPDGRWLAVTYDKGGIAVGPANGRDFDPDQSNLRSIFNTIAFPNDETFAQIVWR